MTGRQPKVHPAGTCPACGGRLELASSGGAVHWFAIVRGGESNRLWTSTPRTAQPVPEREGSLWRCADPGCARMTSLTVGEEAARISPR